MKVYFTNASLKMYRNWGLEKMEDKSIHLHNRISTLFNNNITMKSFPTL